MPMRPMMWTRCSALFVSCVLTWAPAALACAGDDPSYDGLRSSTFDTSAVCRPGEAPLLLHLNQPFATDEGWQAPDLTQVNLDEWVAFFGGKIPRELWAKLLYQEPLSRLDALIFALQKKPGAAFGPNDAPFSSYGDRETLVASLFYVGFAKRVERSVPQLVPNTWDGFAKPEDQDPTALAKLVAAGKKAHAAATNPFLRQRYAFQLVRLHFHRLAAEDGLRFFTEHAADFVTPSSAAWRAKGLAAGLLRKAGKRAEANVAYLEVYDRFAPLKVTTVQSMSWPDDATWERSLSLAKTTREKTLLWQVLGFRVDGVRAMKAIRELDPASDLLPLLVGRELNRLEEDFASVGTRPLDDVMKQRLAWMRGFLESGSEKGNVAQPAGWDLAAGHLRVVTGDLSGAQRFFERAMKRGPLSPALQQQLRASRLLAMVDGKDALDDAAVLRELEWLWPAPQDTRLSNLKGHVRARLSEKFAARGDQFVASCIGGALVEAVLTDASQTARFGDFLTAPAKSPLEAFAIAHCAFKVNDVRELQGLVALYSGDLEQAAKVLGAMKTPVLNADPFVSHIIDRHDDDAADPKHKVYTRAQFVKRLLTLSQDTKSAPKQFELATGLYNMTFSGNSRLVYARTLFNDGTPVVHTAKVAEAAFRRAAELAGKDKELAARATFGVAKCELANFYATRKDDDTRFFIAGSGFKTLASDYAKTKYYREVLEECGYFKAYVNSPH